MSNNNNRKKIKIAERLPLPGLAAISLYLLLLSGVIVVGVVSGRY